MRSTAQAMARFSRQMWQERRYRHGWSGDEVVLALPWRKKPVLARGSELSAFQTRLGSVSQWITAVMRISPSLSESSSISSASKAAIA